MDDFQHLCPVCKVKGKDTFLQLRQINLSTAVYLCKDLKCSYPTGHEWIFVDRDLFQGDDSDSDLSDSVNADIERMKQALDTNKNNNSNEKIVPEFVKSKIPDKITPEVVNPEHTNMVVEDPYDLFSTLSLANEEKPQILAIGMPDIKVDIPKNILASNSPEKEPCNVSNAKDTMIIQKDKTENCNQNITISNKEVEKVIQIKIQNNKPSIKKNILNSVNNKQSKDMKVIDKNNENMKSEKQNRKTEDTDNLEVLYERSLFDSVFKSKTKLQCKKKQPSSFIFNESIVKEALETINMTGTEPRIKPKPSLLQRVMNKNKSKKINVKSAASFDGFTFSSTSFKLVDEQEETTPVQEFASEVRLKNIEENESNQKITNNKTEKCNTENTLDKNNSSNNTIMDDISFSTLFDNIDNLETGYVPNSSVNMEDVDEWLNSF